MYICNFFFFCLHAVRNYFLTLILYGTHSNKSIIFSSAPRGEIHLFSVFPLSCILCLEVWLKSEKCITHKLLLGLQIFFFLEANTFIHLICNKQHDQTENPLAVHRTGRLTSLLPLVGRCTWHCGKHAIIRPLSPPTSERAVLQSKQGSFGSLYFP